MKKTRSLLQLALLPYLLGGDEPLARGYSSKSGLDNRTPGSGVRSCLRCWPRLGRPHRQPCASRNG